MPQKPLYISPVVRTLIYRRIAMGLTQPDMAKILNVTLSAVAAWEQGRRVGTLPHIEEWAAALGLSLTLVDLELYPSPPLEQGVDITPDPRLSQTIMTY